MNMRTDFLREQQARDDEIEAERQKLVKHLSIDFFIESLTEADNSALSECVELFRSGDTMLLGLAVKEIVAGYMEQVAKERK